MLVNRRKALINAEELNESTTICTACMTKHVNKTAQEQFEFRHYNCQFTVYSPKPFLMLFVLKRLFGSVFLGLKFELKVFLDTINVQKKSLNPDNYIIKNLEFPILLLAENNKDKRVYSEKIILKYLQLFDLFGEVNLKSYNSKF